MAYRRKKRKTARPIGFINKPNNYRLVYRRNGKTVVGKKRFKTKAGLRRYVIKLMKRKR